LRQSGNAESVGIYSNKGTARGGREDLSLGNFLRLLNCNVQKRYRCSVYQLIKIWFEIGIIQQSILVCLKFGECHAIRSRRDHKPPFFADNVSDGHAVPESFCSVDSELRIVPREVEVHMSPENYQAKAEVKSAKRAAR
jgi:hypothetical protein